MESARRHGGGRRERRGGRTGHGPEGHQQPGRRDGPCARTARRSCAPLPRRPWYRRRRLVAGPASVCAVLATLGALSTLPDGRRTSADGPDRVTGPTVFRYGAGQGA
ncbi:hypothetical protein [Streptomyces flaveolus]|uniref:hypothetical protein n=1 Tax=Streptomyces flaveolus TaxID=67297 RepID=UPI0036FB3F35